MELVIIIVLIFINGMLSMAEMALVSSRRSKLQQMAGEGDQQAEKVLEMSKMPADYLSTMQVGMTMTGILAGVFSGATVANELAQWMSPVVSFFLVVFLVAYASLIFGELIPKRIALQNPERIAMMLAYPVDTIVRMMYPLVHLVSLSTDIIMRATHIQSVKRPPITEEEIKVLIREGTRAGIFEEAEEDIVHRVLRLGDRRVNAFMTPRGEIDYLDIKDKSREIKKKVLVSVHSRFPVCKGDIDHVMGMVHIKEIIKRCMSDEEIKVSEMMREPFYMPESMRALNALKLFKDSGIHDALITDEYGGIQGMLTLHDLLQAMVGDIRSRTETTEPLYVKREDGSYIIDGMLSVDELKELLRIRHLPKEGSGTYETLGGYIISYLDKIPMVGDKFEADGYAFEVLDMDHNRIDKVLVSAIIKT